MAKTEPRLAGGRRLVVTTVLLCSTSATWAAQPKTPSTNLDHKAFFKPELSISTAHEPLEAALTQLANRGAWETLLTQRGDDPRRPRLKAWLDRRSGAATNVMEAVPLI